MCSFPWHMLTLKSYNLWDIEYRVVKEKTQKGLPRLRGTSSPAILASLQSCPALSLYFLLRLERWFSFFACYYWSLCCLKAVSKFKLQLFFMLNILSFYYKMKGLVKFPICHLQRALWGNFIFHHSWLRHSWGKIPPLNPYSYPFFNSSMHHFICWND